MDRECLAEATRRCAKWSASYFSDYAKELVRDSLCVVRDHSQSTAAWMVLVQEC